MDGTSASLKVRRRLIVNADDFGRSDAINEAVGRAHREGILTTASLMVNEPHAAAAVEIAKANPKLGVGLHLALAGGTAALAREQIPGLVDEARQFGSNPVAVGLRYFFRTGLREQLRAEIRAQVRRFKETGLLLDHLNGHLHLHMHPTVLRIVAEEAPGWGLRHVRLTHDCYSFSLRLARGSHFYRASHALVFSVLSAWALPILAGARLRHAERVFGLLQNGRVDEAYLSRLLPDLPDGDSELYSHPSLIEFLAEFNALVSPRVRQLVNELGIHLVRYQDL